MKHTSFYEFVGRIREATKMPKGAVVREVRDALRQSLAVPAFAADCVELVLETMPEPGRDRWANPPIYDDDECDCTIRMFYWPPGFVNGAHKHDDWTVTGVLHNTLVFFTYVERDGRIVEEKRIEAGAGDVGYIATPCIHNVGNLSATESVSFHVFSGEKIGAGRGRAKWYGQRQAEGAMGNVHFRALGALTGLVAASLDPRRDVLLDRLYALSPLNVKLAIIKTMAVAEPVRASTRLYEIAPLYPPRVASELERIADGLGRQSVASCHGAS